MYQLIYFEMAMFTIKPPFTLGIYYMARQTQYVISH